MARMARVVVPFYPHHVTWRGNRRRRTFFGDDDYSTYVELMAEFCRKAGTRVWAYCLMPNPCTGSWCPRTWTGFGPPWARRTGT